MRFSKHKIMFEKGYETNLTEELFIVMECVLRDLLFTESRTFWTNPFKTQELQKVPPKNEHTIEKIIKKAGGKNC